MAKEQYLASDLDERTRNYLLGVRKAGGNGMAGIYLSADDSFATWGMPLAGAVILGVVLYFVIPPLNNPTHQAMLLTAGLLMGGWLLIAGVRVLVARSSGASLGSFTYADPRQLWIVDGTVVQRWPLKSLQAVRVEGAQLWLRYPDGVQKISVPFEVGILEIATYFAYWLEVRGEGGHDQALIEAHAASARAMAYDQTPDQQAPFSLEIPVPRPDENARGGSRDWPILLGIAVFGVALFFVVRVVVFFWHDHAVFEFVRVQSPAHWRVYLLDERNTLHREEVKKMLHDRYHQKADELRTKILDGQEPEFKGSDEAMVQLLQTLADAPQAIVTLRVHDTTEEKNRPQLGQPNPNHLKDQGQTEVTDALYTAIGQELITLVQPQEDVAAMIDIQFKLARDDKGQRLEWTVAVRKDADSEPTFQAAWTSDFVGDADALNVFQRDLSRIKKGLAGGVP